MINVMVARGYKALAMAVIDAERKELAFNKNKLDKLRTELEAMRPGTRSYVLQRKQICYTERYVQNLEQWDKTEIAQFYWEFATLELPETKKRYKVEVR